MLLDRGPAPATTERNNAWYLYHGARRARTLTPADLRAGEQLARADVDFLEQQALLPLTARILEIGCAWGRHTVELAGRGYSNVLSVDIDPAMLGLARARLAAEGFPCMLREASFREITPGECLFDAVLQFYDRSVLGGPTEEEDRASLCHVASLLRPGGCLLFGIRDWPVDLPRSSRSWQETAEGLELEEVISDPAVMTCTHRTIVIDRGGGWRILELTRRHYSLPEVRALLGEAGFAVTGTWHAYDAAQPYGTAWQGMVVLAHRVGGDMRDE